MAIPALDDFNLVGGTALALKYGHRRSLDLDLFSSQDFDNEAIAAIISKISQRLPIKDLITLLVYLVLLILEIKKLPQHHIKAVRTC